VANGSRGVVTALDPEGRTLTLRLDGHDGRTVTLPRTYLEGRSRASGIGGSIWPMPPPATAPRG
jgi:hypothetical protein